MRKPATGSPTSECSSTSHGRDHFALPTPDCFNARPARNLWGCISNKPRHFLNREQCRMAPYDQSLHAAIPYKKRQSPRRPMSSASGLICCNHDESSSSSRTPRGVSWLTVLLLFCHAYFTSTPSTVSTLAKKNPWGSIDCPKTHTFLFHSSDRTRDRLCVTRITSDPQIRFR